MEKSNAEEEAEKKIKTETVEKGKNEEEKANKQYILV